MTEDDLHAWGKRGDTLQRQAAVALVERCRRLREALVSAHRHFNTAAEWERIADAIERDSADAPLSPDGADRP